MPSSSTSSKPVRVLIVDDNEAILARTTAVLRASCEVVGAARDGRAALASAASLRPDVIVLDISMPGMTGLEVASSLRQAGSTAAVVFLTVHNEEEFVEAAIAAGGLGYVTKPRLGTDLVAAVREAKAGRGFFSPIEPRPR
jgi:DNA-binding NarL/FixJ family response regulator